MDLEALCGFAQLARPWPEPMSALDTGIMERRRCVGDLRAADSRPGRVPWPEASRLIDRIFNGRPLRLLGYDRQLLVLAHRTLAAAPEAAMGAEMGGRETRPNQFLTTENQIRVFYPMYGRDMGIGAASDLTNGAAAK